MFDTLESNKKSRGGSNNTPASVEFCLNQERRAEGGPTHPSLLKPPLLYLFDPSELKQSKYSILPDLCLLQSHCLMFTPPTHLPAAHTYQQHTQPGPQVPLQGGHTHCPLSTAACWSSPCRFLRQLALHYRSIWDGRYECQFVRKLALRVHKVNMG